VNSGLNSIAAADQLQHVHKNLDFGKIVPPRFPRWRSPALGNDGSWLERPLLAADIRRSGEVRKVPIVLKKSFLADELKFFWDR
jgi:hypothetical protein